ncbi:MAG: DUF86 domain-containing protein [Bacteroides sp.]|nr:DUF86 domain-containing protein [Bacteroidales bacterium]MBD5315448.1 DUF86 domain-containing protein [Bacteroides sp.]MDE7448659.1 DUF86 domain-containing protein [Paramuribaculum sp.]
MDERILKYLHDMIDAIQEIDEASVRFGKSYAVFEGDVVYRKFVERNIEILGEAMNRILKVSPEVSITSARKIVDTRNYVIHAYDSLKPDILWAIVVNHLPLLKKEIMALLECHATS